MQSTRYLFWKQILDQVPATQNLSVEVLSATEIEKLLNDTLEPEYKKSRSSKRLEEAYLRQEGFSPQ